MIYEDIVSFFLFVNVDSFLYTLITASGFTIFI